MGHLTLIAFPILENLMMTLGSRVGTKSHLWGHLEIVLMEKNTGVLELSTCFKRIKQLLLTFNIN